MVCRPDGWSRLGCFRRRQDRPSRRIRHHGNARVHRDRLHLHLRQQLSVCPVDYVNQPAIPESDWNRCGCSSRRSRHQRHAVGRALRGHCAFLQRHAGTSVSGLAGVCRLRRRPYRTICQLVWTSISLGPPGASTTIPRSTRAHLPTCTGPYPGYAALTTNKAIGRANWNGMTVSARHRTGHGLFLTGAYTYSHGLSNSFSQSCLWWRQCSKCAQPGAGLWQFGG